MCEITVYLMTRNRPQFVLRAIKSILSQSFYDFKFIVSDNSTNDDIKNLVKKENIKDSRFSYIKRECPFESGIDHINAIHQEVQSHYYIIFHDDDIMLSDMVNKLYEAIKEDNRIIAVGAFAYTVKDGKRTMGKICKHKEIINSPITIIDKYASGSYATFASYMYNKYLMSNLIEKKNGGKYSDCSFIASLVRNGLIVHIPNHLMEITVHEGQDSQDHQFSEYLSLTTYLKKLIGKREVKRISNLRIFNIYNERIRRYKVNCRPLYSFRVLFLFFKYSPTNFFPKYILRILHLYNK